MKAKTILNTSGALVTLGGAAVGSYYALNSKSATKPSLNSGTGTEQVNSKKGTRKPISEWLQSKTDKPMLPTNDVHKNALWEKKWQKFKTWYEKTRENKDWEIFDWVTKKDTGDAYTQLKELCNKNLEKEADDQDKLINQVIEYCVEE